MLDEAENQRIKREQEKARQKLARKEAMRQKREVVAERKEPIEKEMKHNPQTANRQKWFKRELRQVIEDSDVILEVLDARDPIGTRCPSIEAHVQKLSQTAVRPKRIVLILNKIDLVPAEAAKQWLQYLQSELPAIAFKALTQNNAKAAALPFQSIDSISTQQLKHSVIGVDAVLQLIHKYSASLGVKSKITVIGLPNVGKSSIINSLKRDKVAGVSPQPGFTHALQSIKLGKFITLIDSPGVIAQSDRNESEVLLHHCVKVDQIPDPIAVAEQIIAKAGPDRLCCIYKTAAFNSSEQFLYNMAQSRGKLGKGGVPDLDAVARLLISDWNAGKIPYFTAPPQSAPASAPQLVANWSKEFDVDGLLDQSNEQALSSLRPHSAVDAIQLNPSQAVPCEMDFDDDDEEEEEEESGGSDADEADFVMPTEHKASEAAHLSMRAQQKKAKKAQAKQTRRQQKQSNQPYSFDADLW